MARRDRNFLSQGSRGGGGRSGMYGTCILMQYCPSESHDARSPSNNASVCLAAAAASWALHGYPWTSKTPIDTAKFSGQQSTSTAPTNHRAGTNLKTGNTGKHRLRTKQLAAGKSGAMPCRGLGIRHRHVPLPHTVPHLEVLRSQSSMLAWRHASCRHVDRIDYNL